MENLCGKRSSSDGAHIYYFNEPHHLSILLMDNLMNLIVVGIFLFQDGRLQVGDQLVSINKESLIGASNEEAQSILASTKLRSVRI